MLHSHLVFFHVFTLTLTEDTNCEHGMSYPRDFLCSPGTLDSCFININVAAVALNHPLIPQRRGARKSKSFGLLFSADSAHL